MLLLYCWYEINIGWGQTICLTDCLGLSLPWPDKLGMSLCYITIVPKPNNNGIQLLQICFILKILQICLKSQVLVDCWTCQLLYEHVSSGYGATDMTVSATSMEYDTLIVGFVVWFDFMPINATFVSQFLPMDSENDFNFVARLTLVNVLHWIVGLYYYGFLVNEGIGLILCLVIQTFDPSTLSVL